MASEIQVTSQLQATKSSLTIAHNKTFKADLTGSVYAAGAQSIATTSAGVALSMGDVTTAGWSYLLNTDATNYLEVGVQVSGTFYPSIKLLPGESCAVRLGTSAPYARAHTAACILQYTILQA